MVVILAVEASCDETAVAISKNGQLLSTITRSQIKQHAPYGGVVPELASRLHLCYFNLVTRTACQKANVRWNEIDYIAYTATPGLIGCLNITRVFTRMLALVLQKPLLAVNHLFAHIYANNISQRKLQFPLLGLVVSGGHTHLYYLKSPLSFQLIAQSTDDAAGECLDKVGRLLGFDYPAGPLIEQWATKGQFNFRFSLPKTRSPLNFSFSGLKTACLQTLQNNKLIAIKADPIKTADFCYSLQQTVINIITSRLRLALAKFSVRMIAGGGGVVANARLRNELAKIALQYNKQLALPASQFCTDNAAMVASLAWEQLTLTKVK